MEARYLTNENGERVGVVLDVGEYERLRDAAEELEDIAAADEARAELERGEAERVPWEASKERRRGEARQS